MSAGSLAQTRPQDFARTHGGGSSRAPVGTPALAAALRALLTDAPEPSRRMADAAASLWTRVLRFDAADPRWPDRDRFVLAAAAGPLRHALLHLTGHDGIDADDLAAAHDPGAAHPAIEAGIGPAGHGIAAAVGMALAERLLAARFGRSLVDHRVWAIASEAELMAGIGHEAASLAGHLRLDRLTVLYDASGTLEGGCRALACSEDVARRFAAYGWAVRPVDGRDSAALLAALSLAVRSRKPMLIACRPPPCRAEAAPAPHDGTIAAHVAAAWHVAGARGAAARRAWLKRLARHPRRPEFERATAGRLPDAWYGPFAELRATPEPLSAREAGRQGLALLAVSVPELVGGAADHPAAAQAQPHRLASVVPGTFAGRFIHFGARAPAMAGCLGGLARHGGVIPAGVALLDASEPMHPALRLAARMRQRIVLMLEETGSESEPLAALRAIAGLSVFRPAGATETAECWELALRRADGPSALVLGRRAVAAPGVEAAENRCARGGYVLAEAEGPRQLTLVASGAEVATALAARAALADAGVAVAVVSLPCWDLFGIQDETWRASVLGRAPRIGIEAGGGFGWERWLGEDGVFVGAPGSAAVVAAGLRMK